MAKQELVEEKMAVEIKAAQKVADEYALRSLAGFSGIERAVRQAQGIKALRAAITPLMPSLEPLMNTALGFDTDRNPSKPGKNGDVRPYPAEVVRDCIVEALLRGANVCGNEFNIIAGRCYSTLSYYERMVKTQIAGLTDLDTSTSPPFPQGGHQCVLCRASWKLDGKAHELKDSRGRPGAIFAIPTNSMTGNDAIISKAKRRMYKAIWEKCTNVVFTEPTLDEVPELPPPATEPVKSQAERVLEHVKKQQSTPAPETAPPANRPMDASQRDTIGKMRHVVNDEEFQILIEGCGKFDLDQLTHEEAANLISKLGG